MNDLILVERTTKKSTVKSSSEVQSKKLSRSTTYAIVCTKQDKNHTLEVLSPASHVSTIDQQELSRQAESLKTFLKKVLPTKLYTALYMAMAQEITSKRWSKNKAKQAKREAKNREKKEAEVEEEPVSWKETVPDSFEQ